MLDTVVSLQEGYPLNQTNYLLKGYFEDQKDCFWQVFVVHLVLELTCHHSQELQLTRLMVHELTLDILPQLQEFVMLILANVQVVYDYPYRYYLSSSAYQQLDQGHLLCLVEVSFP